MGLYRHNGKENGNYRHYRGYIGAIQGLYRGYRDYRVCIGVIIRIMEKKIETTTVYDGIYKGII